MPFGVGPLVPVSAAMLGMLGMDGFKRVVPDAGVRRGDSVPEEWSAIIGAGGKVAVGTGMDKAADAKVRIGVLPDGTLWEGISVTDMG